MATKKQRKKKRRRSAPAPRPAPVERPARPKQTTGRPEPPWGKFPLSELVVLVAVVMLFAGFFVGPPRGPLLLGTGLVLGALAGLELALREHLAGYRSHTMLIAGFAGMVTLAVSAAALKLPLIACAGMGLVVAGIAGWRLALLFRARSGGALFKVGEFKR